jgi:hypothetical protein
MGSASIPATVRELGPSRCYLGNKGDEYLPGGHPKWRPTPYGRNGRWQALDGSMSGTTPFRVFIKDSLIRRSP